MRRNSAQLLVLLVAILSVAPCLMAVSAGPAPDAKVSSRASQGTVIKGNVTEMGSTAAVVGAVVKVQNTTLNATTDGKGKFTIAVPPTGTSYDLQASKVGYLTKTARSGPVANNTTVWLDFVLVRTVDVLNWTPKGQSVRVDTTIQLTFDAKMDNGSVEKDLNLTPPLLEPVLVWNANYTTVKLVHAIFKFETTYTVRLTAASKAADGTTLVNGFSWSFKTEKRGTGTLTGTVNSYKNVVHVPMALVTCTNHYDKNEHYTTYQKSDMYQFNALPSGTYEIYASKDGYKDSVVHTITILNNDFVDLNLDLREMDIDYGTINGRVLSQGVGLSSANVNIQGPSATNLTVVTRLDGNFTANVKPGSYNITISFDGYVTQANTLNVTLGNISAINFTMEKVPPTPHGDSESPTWTLILVLGSIVMVIIIVVSVAFAYRAGKKARSKTKSGQTCPKCGLLVDDGLEKCPSCGRNLQAKTFRCPECGTELEVGAKKCPTCWCKNFEFKESEESDNAVRKEGSVFGNIDYDDEVEEE